MRKSKNLFLIGLAIVLSACSNLSSLSSSIDTSFDAESSSISETSTSEIESKNSNETTTKSSKDSSSAQSSFENSSKENSSSSVEKSSSKSSSSSTIYSSEESTTSYKTDSMWKVNFNEYGTTFRDTLSTLIAEKKTKTTTYKACLSIGAAAAAYPNKNSNTFIPFYHTYNSDSDLAKVSSCNREHTWPNSRGGSCCETDPFMVRPTFSKDNSSRGNNFYGLGGNEFDPAEFDYDGARGESARVIFYVATRYAANGLSLSNNPSDSTGLKTMGTLKYLVQWNKQYPVSDMEKQINEYLYEQGYGRNPFVDHPEYVDFIWNEKGYVKSKVDVGSSSYEEDSSSSSSIDADEYSLVDAISDIDGASLAIVSSSKTNASDYYGLTATAKSDSTPWYLTGVSVTLSEDKSLMRNTYEQLAFYEFNKQTDGTYTIYCREANVFLYSYIDGTHYSVGLTSKTPSNGTIYWTIEALQTGGFTFYSKDGVYFEYYSGSFCGYKSTNQAIYLYC